jgi:hypothetical protein
VKNFIKQGLIISWALAIFYLHLGSLVNFHQHHLWKKYLIPTVIAGKKVKNEEDTLIVKVNKQSGNIGLSIDPVSYQVFESKSTEQSCFVTLVLFSRDVSSLQDHLPSAQSLRAPPLA